MCALVLLFEGHDQRRRAYLRLQELRERRDEPQAAGAHHLWRGPPQQPPCPTASAKLSAFRGEFDPAWPIIRLLEKLRLVKVLTEVDEGWEDHHRHIPQDHRQPRRRHRRRRDKLRGELTKQQIQKRLLRV